LLLVSISVQAETGGEKALKKSKDFRANIKVKYAQEFTLPKLYHEGLMIDGKNIWVANGEGGKFWIVDRESGKLVSEIDSPAIFTEALQKAGDRYWISDWTSKRLLLARFENGKFIVDKKVPLMPANPAGIVFNGEKLYVITWTRGVGTRYDLWVLDKEANLIEKVKIENISEPSQLAWDGESLWISSWFDRRVYKINPVTYEIEAYFRTSIEKTTGIVWDGEGFWVTGTDFGLRKIELVKDTSK